MSQRGNVRRQMVLLFTDIEGSVKYKRTHGDVIYARALCVHNDLFRQIIGEFDGEIRNQTGDGFVAGFDTNSDAVLLSALAVSARACRTSNGRPSD